MKVRITAFDFVVPYGTVLEVGNTPPRSWQGSYVVVDPDASGLVPIDIPHDTPAPIEQPPRKNR